MSITENQYTAAKYETTKNVKELSSKVNIEANIYLNVKYMVIFG